MTHIRRILCPVDFSEYSRQALDFAVAIARWYDARITVLYVRAFSMPVLATGPFIGTEVFGAEPLTDRERTDLRHRLTDFVASDVAAGAAIDIDVDQGYSVSACIVSQAKGLDADLITMGTHGRSGLDHALIGSVAEKVLRKAPCPVLTVPPLAHEAVPTALERIVCAVDFSKRSAGELEYAVSIAERAGARLTVLHVIDLPPEVPQLRLGGLAEYRAARFEQARGWMAELVTPALHARCPIDELLLVGTPSREIVRTAAEQHADLVIMGVQGRGALDLMFFGSTTNHVIQRANCPVLTVRGKTA